MAPPIPPLKPTSATARLGFPPRVPPRLFPRSGTIASISGGMRTSGCILAPSSRGGALPLDSSTILEPAEALTWSLFDSAAANPPLPCERLGGAPCPGKTPSKHIPTACSLLISRSD
eukprot:CAMPEP_0170436380 /NCGR_PEP_ID=MMETSP0117_2-20130122/44111_1 /TAXON_ID=400756 /ORGANISM="Durinskia baltica, Strain CSIRO CS-38" /LENGTH=116 /DNA_ID=CAMNT_0010696413 /DNA_START=432 /DNA_END=782 /DNA_ORIENTATION=-